MPACAVQEVNSYSIAKEQGTGFRFHFSNHNFLKGKDTGKLYRHFCLPENTHKILCPVYFLHIVFYTNTWYQFSHWSFRSSNNLLKIQNPTICMIFAYNQKVTLFHKSSFLYRLSGIHTQEVTSCKG